MAHHDHHHGVNHTHDTSAFESGEHHGQVTFDHHNTPVAFTFQFKDGHVHGHGEDSVGSFQLNGTYNSTSGELSFKQQYNGKHTVTFSGKYLGNHAYEGSVDDEAHGKKGSFHLKKGAHHDHHGHKH